MIATGDGSGGFTRGAPYLSGCNDIALGDFDADGETDIAAAIDTAVLTILHGNGDGTFTEGAFTSPTGVQPIGILVDDFDDDGILDLAIGSDSDQIIVLLGQGTGGVGDGSFGASEIYQAPHQIDALTSADFGGDGITDIAGKGPCTVDILFGNGVAGVDVILAHPAFP